MKVKSHGKSCTISKEKVKGFDNRCRLLGNKKDKATMCKECRSAIKHQEERSSESYKKLRRWL